MDNSLLKPLNALESSLNTLIHSLTQTNTFSAAPNAAKDLVSADDALSSALVTLKQHQDNYARILKLRAEADKLNSNIKEIVRTCVDLRKEIGSIHPSILDNHVEEKDEDNEEQPNLRIKPVDYETLLSFAARIGKHNALAAREAELDAIQRRVDAKRKREESQQQAQAQIQTQSQQGTTRLNGAVLSGSALEDEGAAEDVTNQAANNTTQESQAELAAIKDNLASQRAYLGQAFPSADRLRMGQLGRLQLLREQSGENAVEAEIERMVKESELGIVTTPAAAGVPGSATIPGLSDTTGPAATAASQPERKMSETMVMRPPQPRPSISMAARPPPPRKPLDLDFPDSDEEDED